MLEKYRGEIATDLSGILASVANGTQSLSKAADAARAVVLRVYLKAAGLGAAVVGLPSWNPDDSQVDRLGAMADRTVEFFAKFARGVSDEALGNAARLGMYGGSADDAFWTGFAAGLPSQARIWWTLGIAEHCEDCLGLAAGSPYDKPGTGSNPLPTLPRAGDTKCIVNCRCHLVTEGFIDAGLMNPIGVEVVQIGGVNVDPTSPGAVAAAQLYQDLAERYAWFSRMHELDPTAGYGAAAADTREQIKRLAETHAHTVRFRMNQTEMLEPVRAARAAGMRFIDPNKLDDDLLLLIAAVLASDDIERGRIKKVGVNPPTVTLDDDRAYRLDSVGKGILFVE